MRYKHLITSRETIERVRVVGLLSEARAVMEAMHADNYRLKRTGAHPNPQYTGTHFLFIAEKTTPTPITGRSKAHGIKKTTSRTRT